MSDNGEAAERQTGQRPVEFCRAQNRRNDQPQASHLVRVLVVDDRSAVLAVVLALVLPQTFTARGSFVAESGSFGSQLPSGLMGIASQFGVSVSGQSDSPDFYAEVLRSRTIRDRVLQTTFESRGLLPETLTPNSD